MSKGIYFGVDIGATKTVFLLVKINGVKYEILESVKIATPRKKKDILKMVEDNFKILSSEKEISAIGIGFAGSVDFEQGVAIMGPNLKIGKIEFKKILERKFPPLLKLRRTRKIPVAVDNDARCFVLAESIFGSAKKYKNIIGLTIGTGIGGGIIIDGKIYRGATGSAGEFGHTNIEKEKEFEEGASGSGLANIYRKISGNKADSFAIVDLAKKKNKAALQAVETVAENLGIGLANVLETFNPEIIVLGGGLAEVDLIVNKAKEYSKKKVFLPSLAETPIVVSKLGQNAVALGAAWIASQK